MDQSFVSGLGNIYVNEILLNSNIDPHRRHSKIERKEIKRLFKIQKNIKKGYYFRRIFN